MGSEKCAKLINVSTSSFRKELSDVNALLKGYGVQIVGKSGKGNGYQLVIHDEPLFNSIGAYVPSVFQFNGLMQV